MKQYLVIALGLLLVPQATLAQPGVLVAEYPFTGDVSTVGTWNNLILSSAGPMYAGSGLSAVGYVNGQFVFPDRAKWATNWSLSGYDQNDHFGCQLIPQLGYILIIDSVTFKIRRSSTAPDTIEFRMSTTGVFLPFWKAKTGATDAWKKFSITSGFIPAASTVDLRVYGRNATGTGGAMRIDDFRVYAHLQNVFNLPVELLSFRGDAREDHIALSWETATEQNNAFFTIERSVDFINWQEIGIVPGTGHSLENQEYELADFHPEKGKNYYRLSQTDINGTHEVLETIAVLWHTEGNGLTRILSVCGNEIFSWSETHILHDLPPGVYLLQGEYETRKIVIP